MPNQLVDLPESLQKKLSSLRELVNGYRKVCIAYSGGVDSSLVASIAYEQLGENALAITGISPALSPQLRTEAINQAKWKMWK